MDRRMKRSSDGVVVLLLIMCMAFGVNVSGLKVSAEEWGDYHYEILENGTVSITGYTGKDSVLKIPDTIDNKKVTSIGDSAFWLCSGLTSVTIPDSVTSIGYGAFSGCDNVILIVEKDSYAEQYAKDNNIPYQYIEIKNTDNTTEEPEQLTTEQPIPNQPAEEEEQVVVGSVTMVLVATETDNNPVVDDKVKIQNGSSTIKKGTVLVSKTGIYKVINVKKKTVTYIGTKKKKASSIKVPEEIKIKKKKYKVTSVSANAFKNNKKIKAVTIGQNVKEIGKNAFRGCKNLKMATIGKNVTTIGSYAFYGCKKLNLIEIRSSKLKKVGKAAFKKIAKHPTARVPKGMMQSYKKLFEGKM
ncbi:MAG: leucine-rich repeat domain-containing protein [Lachnospiraceae bacterium]|nr:leucine-rich repeat domain-containing protein [Lachnospiraceae bacterium]